MEHKLLIDCYAHVLPPRYRDTLYRLTSQSASQKKNIDSLVTLYDMEARFEVMDRYPGLVLVLVPSYPTLDDIPDRQTALDLARLYNDEMAELIQKYPRRFVGAVATLPMGNIDDAVGEAERAMDDLKFRGVNIYTPINDKPLDSPEFMPLYEKMADYGLPIWIHPRRAPDYPDYRTESKSLYEICRVYGWPLETTVAMHRLVYSGVLEKYPDLKFITHHCGGMVPYLADRIIGFRDQAEMRRKDDYPVRLKKHPIEYFKSFYNDTALYGNTAALMCAYDFFGADHLLFATDFAHDNQQGDRYLRQTINAISRMAVSDEEKTKIFEDNVRKLLRLPV